MSYPTPPGPRMAYDEDGSVGVCMQDGGTVQTLDNSTEGQRLYEANGELYGLRGMSYGSGSGPHYRTHGIIFPELRDIVAIFVASYNGIDQPVETSNDTTNGFDGTWTSTGVTPAFINSRSDWKAYARNSITSLTASGINAIRWRMNVPGSETIETGGLHIYGHKSTYDALTMWQPVTNAALDGTEFDYGNVTQGTTEDRTFRVKNSHGSLTANDISIDTEALTNASHSLPPQFTFSIDGGGFSTPLSIGDLAPGAISDVITVRRTTPSDADLSLWWARFRASATSWT